MNTQIILLRHGQPALQNSLLGKTDSKLTQLGWQQLKLNTLPFNDLAVVVTSPLLRCKQFAMDFAIKNGLNFECVDGFQECDFGDWDGLEYEALHLNYEKEFTQFIANPNNFTAPNGESLQSFNDRVDQSLKQLLKEHAGKKILLITHGGVIRSLVAWCLDMPRLSNIPFQRLSIDYGSISQIDIYQDEESDSLFSKLVSLNQVPRVLL